MNLRTLRRWDRRTLRRWDRRTFWQRYLYRAADRLANTWRISTIVGTCVLFIVSVTMLALTKHGSNPVIMIAGIILLFASMLGGIFTFMFADFYDHQYDEARDLKIAGRLASILEETGTLPAKTLQQHYNAHHFIKLPRPLRKIASRDYVQHLITYNSTRETVALSNNPVPRIPYPAAGDYQTAYYQLHARLTAIREHPELLHVQDSLIDDLYGIG